MQSNQLIISIIILIIIWSLIERKLIVTTRYLVTSARFPSGTKKTSLVILADLHNNTFGKNNVRLVKQIDKLAPDFILVAGDMINKKEIAYPSNAFALLESLVKKYKIYYAYGNHEQRMELYGEAALRSSEGSTSNDGPMMQNLDRNKLYSTWAEYRKKLETIGVVFLDNESIRVCDNKSKLCFTGLSIGHAYFERNHMPDMDTTYLKDLICSEQEGDYHILIAHNPLYFKHYADWGADLVVSGHFHGGMVRIPGVGGLISPQVKFFPKYDAGKHTQNGSTMVVSRGLGSHSVMPRLFNVPELVYIELKGDK